MRRTAHILAATALVSLAGTVPSGVATAGPKTAVPEPVTVVVEALGVSRPLTAGCADDAYNLSGYRVSGSISFAYNPAGAPASVARYAGVAVSNSLHTIVGGATRGTRSRPLNVGAAYAGTTTRAPQVARTGAATGNDGVNVVGWGVLPAQYLAITCIYYSGGVVRNADILLNKRYNWFLGRPAHPTHTFDLQSVLTHEQGHAFGLSHVDPTRYGTQTMATYIAPYDTTKRLLARGDYAGLVRLYGAR